MGRFVAAGSRLYEVNPQTRIKTAIASVFEGKETGYAMSANPVIDEAVTAAQDYLDAITTDVIEAFAKADPKALKQLYKGAH